jgi:hypothetical protein
MSFLLPVAVGLNPDPLVRWTFKAGTERGLRLGEARGRAQALAIILDEKQIQLTERQRVRIESSSDPEASERWLRAAVHATCADEVFV